MGGWRDRYRAEGGGEPEKGIAKSGQKFAFHYALPVDASGELPDGRKFRDVREFKRLLLDDEEQLARNLAQQLTVYATGAPVRFSDRADRSKSSNAPARSELRRADAVHEIVQSELFLQQVI